MISTTPVGTAFEVELIEDEPVATYAVSVVASIEVIAAVAVSTIETELGGALGPRRTTPDAAKAAAESSDGSREGDVEVKPVKSEAVVNVAGAATSTRTLATLDIDGDLVAIAISELTLLYEVDGTADGTEGLRCTSLQLG